MRSFITSASFALIIRAQKFAEWSRILKSPNRAEFILIATLVGFIQSLILYFFDHTSNFFDNFEIIHKVYKTFAMFVCILVEEFVQFSIASKLPTDRLFINCGKYALGWWFLESICIIPVLLFQINSILSHKFLVFGIIMTLILRILSLSVFFLATITRYFSLKNLKKYAILLFILQILFHVYWNIGVAINEDALRIMFRPFLGLTA